MSLLSIILIAVGLGMDAFAVAIGTGITIKRLSFGPVFRQSFHFGLFQFMMPVIGWTAGRTVADYIRDYDHWIAFVLLACIGSKMIWDSVINGQSGAFAGKDPTRGLTLLLLSVATSIDALAVGLSLAFLDIGILYPSVVIGIVAAFMTVCGMVFGDLLGKRVGKKAGILGGLILIG
ncbi:MAG: manganese efflux pump, partial [Deltaproteobacteria bacterium]|nr:manganese efflux pump [Deltaproteobacteria bacterium]